MTILAMGDVPRHYAEIDPDRVCLIDPEGELTWAALEARASRRARQLADHGVVHDDLVTLALPNGNLFYEFTFALWKLGATPHVVSPKLPRRELDETLALAQPRVLVGDVATGAEIRMLRVDEDAHGYPGESFASGMATHWKAMSSGGSTGRPRIIVDHMPAVFDTDIEMAEIPQGRTILNPGPLYHNSPFAMTHIALFRGNQVVGMPRFDALGALELIARHRVAWVTMVPTMMLRIWRLPPEKRKGFDISSLEHVVHMAAPMPAWLKENWIDWLGPDRICELYGGTERTGATWITGREWLERRGSVGRFNDGTEVKVVGESGRECPAGEIGEIYLRPATGPGSTYHYIGSDRRMDADGWESLGDIGWLDEDGYLYLADRRTDLILSGGANIYPAEVESALQLHAAVDSAAVIGLPHEDLGQAVHAIVHLRADSEPVTEESLQAFLEDQLVRYKQPRSYEFVDVPLRDDAGKVRRSRLRQERIEASPRVDQDAVDQDTVDQDTVDQDTVDQDTGEGM